MNWIRSYGDGSRGGVAIPTGSIIKGIVVWFQALQSGGSQSGGTYDCSIFKNGSPVASKTGSILANIGIGGFGASNDLWGLGALATPAYFSTGIYFGLHLNFPSISADITVQAWNGYMDIYYDDPTPVPTSISVGAGNNQSAQISTQYGLQLYAVVRDQGGNPMAGKSVTFTMPGSGASAGFNSLGGPLTATAITNASGGAVSPFFFANGIAGSFQPVADVTGTSPLVFTLFTATNTPPPVVLVPTTISIIQGNSQQAVIGTAFSVQQKVWVKDQNGTSMNNVDIAWSVPASGARGTYAGGTPAQSFTNSSGVATAPVLTANAIAGTWTAVATCTGYPVTQNFSFTNLANNAPPTPTTIQIQSGNGQSVALSGTFPNDVQVKVIDQYGSPIVASVTATIPASTYGTWQTGGGTVRTLNSTAGTGIANFGKVIASGTARANWAIAITCTGTSGASIDGLNNVDAAVVTDVLAVGGTSQMAPPSSSFTLPLTARATNGLGNGVQNVSITFNAPGSAASCRFLGNLTQTVLTDVNGNAVSAIPVATATEGAYTVTATTPGLVALDPSAGLHDILAQFPLQNGVPYLPEVCTAQENPQSASSTTFNQNGSPISAWLNPTQAIGNPASTTIYSTNVQQPPVGNRSQGLLFAPPPGSWATVLKDDALITKLRFQIWGRGLPLGGTLAVDAIRISFAKNGATTAAYNLVPYVGWGNGVFSQFAVATYSPPLSGAGAITKADLLSGSTGFVITNVPGSGTVPGAGFNLNGATMGVCYQDKDLSGTLITIPLQVCEV